MKEGESRSIHMSVYSNFKSEHACMALWICCYVNELPRTGYQAMCCAPGLHNNLALVRWCTQTFFNLGVLANSLDVANQFSV